MRKYFAVVLCLLTLFVSSAPAFAASVGQELQPIVGTNAVLNLDGATVNVSDESVENIASAVYDLNSELTYTAEYEVINGVYVPEAILKNFPYVTFYYQGGVVALCWLELPTFGDNSISDADACFRVKSGSVTSWDYGNVWYSVDVPTNMTPYFLGNNAKASSFDIYRNGSVFFSANFVYETKCYVSFETGFDDLILDDVLSEGFIAPVPSYAGYRFDGWYFDEAYTQPFYDGYDFLVSTTLYAKWSKLHEVKYDTGIDDFSIDSAFVADGDIFTVPDFIKQGYEYVGAFVDEDRTVQYIPGSITGDTTIYLRFEPILYDVGALLAETNTILSAMLFLFSIWSAVYFWKNVLGR